MTGAEAHDTRWPPRYSDLAIETALTLGMVFGLRLRQTEGFVTSVLELIGLDFAVPDHAIPYPSSFLPDHTGLPRRR
jgi:hypothetical protein